MKESLVAFYILFHCSLPDSGSVKTDVREAECKVMAAGTDMDYVISKKCEKDLLQKYWVPKEDLAGFEQFATGNDKAPPPVQVAENEDENDDQESRPKPKPTDEPSQTDPDEEEDTEVAAVDPKGPIIASLFPPNKRDIGTIAEEAPEEPDGRLQTTFIAIIGELILGFIIMYLLGTMPAKKDKP